MSKKSPGFYVALNLPEHIFGSKVDYEGLKDGLLKVLEEDWGPRCETKDLDDFPDEFEPIFPIGDPDIGRCGVCLVYEKFDAFWKALVGEE